ncbi:uncharacterized protein [Apostichopus japonicus]|uniref:uncharacterized protein isoform X3 n=1 Tax=Stichopus japonicus TaxID=307972 RepID=UPI003AB57A73
MEPRNTPPLGGMNTPPPGRKRPRTDKPPSNMYGDKRRREQETSYMQELVELITSVSNPESLNMTQEKLAPLLERWNQMNRKDQQQELEQQGSEVQHSQVSSSKPGMLSGDSLESVLLQTLDGFLFVVNMNNNKAEIEYVSGNIQSYLNYKKEELIGQSIYNFIHVGDHNHSISCLVPNSSNSGGMWKSDQSGASVSRSFTCRMQIKCEDSNNGINQETRYENMKCSAMLKPATEKDGESSSSAEGEGTSHLYIIAQRASDEDRSSSMLPSIEEMGMELDVNCCILSVDTSKVKPPYHSREEMISQPIYKYCFSSDRIEMRKYFDEVKEKGSANSPPYSFQLFPELWVYVQMKSHIQKNSINGQTEIVVVHTIIRDAELSKKLKSPPSTSSQATTTPTSRVLEALSNMKPGLHTSTVNQLTRIMMQRSKQKQQHQHQQQQQQQHQQQQQQQQQQGLGYGANSMNMHPQDRLMPIHQGGGGMMLAGTPPLPDRTNFQGMNTFGQVPNASNANIVSQVVGGAPMPNLEPSTLTHMPSSSGHGRPGVELDDNDVFLPNLKSQDPSKLQHEDGKDKRKSVDNPSPDTNDETDNEFLRRNILLSKLLEDEETNIDNLDDEIVKGSPPTTSAASTTVHAKHQSSKPPPVHRKDVLDNTLLKTMLEEEQIRQHQVAEVNPKKLEQSERERATSKSTLLASMLDGDPSKMFGSGKLPKEQPGFISSTIVSTTTALRNRSDSLEDRKGDGEKKEGGPKKTKKKNELLERLLREEDPCSSSDQNQNLKKSQDKSEGSPNKDTTTSPTVTTTKPRLSSNQTDFSSMLDDDSSLLSDEESNSVIQQIIQAASNFPDDLGANNPNLIVDILKEFENSTNVVEREFVKQILSPEQQLSNQMKAQGNLPPYKDQMDQQQQQHQQQQQQQQQQHQQQQQQQQQHFTNLNQAAAAPRGSNSQGTSYTNDNTNMNFRQMGMGIPANSPMNTGTTGTFNNLPGPPSMLQGLMPGNPSQTMNKAPQFVPNPESMYRPGQNMPVSTQADKMKEKTVGNGGLGNEDSEEFIQQLEQVLSSGELDMSLPRSSSTPSSQDNFSNLWNNKQAPAVPSSAQPTNIPSQSMPTNSYTQGVPVAAGGGKPMGQVMGHPASVGNQQVMPDGNAMQMPNSGMVSSTMMPGMGQPRFQTTPGGNPRPGYPSSMPLSNQMQSMMPMQGTGHPPDTMTRQPNSQLKNALMKKQQQQRWQEQHRQQQQQQQQQQMLQQQRLMQQQQQQKNLMMLQQKQQQQTFTGPQKANIPYSNQMGNFPNHPMQPGGSMGPRPMHHGMQQQFPQGAPSARPSPDYGHQFGQMMPQNRSMPSAYQGSVPQHNMHMPGFHGPDFSGGMTPGGSMGPAGNMNALSGMMHNPNRMAQMGNQHPGMGMNPAMGGTGMPQTTAMNPNLRPNMRPGVSMGSRMANPPLNRSMSMPQSTMNPYQMQNSQNFANFAPNNPNMAIRPTGGGMGGISRQASMPDAMNANMWNGGSTGNVPGPYNTAVATSASSMAANQFGNTGGGMEFQNMMQRGGMPGQMGHSTMGNNPNMAAVNMQPPNQQGGFPGGQGNPQQTASTTTNNSGTSYPTSGSGVTAGMMQQHGGNSELDKMMNFDFNKPDGMMGQNPAMPPQAGIPDTSGNARRMQMNNTQNRVHKEAKARFQKFCKYSDAKEAPDASTRVANLFRNQLIGMAPNLPTNDVGVPSTFLATPGSNQQRVPQENMDQSGGDSQDDGNKHSLLQKLLSST